MTETMATDRPETQAPRRRNRSRITNGSKLLPGVHSQSVWARIMRDVRDAVVAQLGGEDQLAETQRLQVRRVAVLETEMVHIESELARVRNEGGQPDKDLLALYCTLANAQRRACEPLGWQHVPRDVTPSLQQYIASKRAEGVG
jgi:hypothetical protein